MLLRRKKKTKKGKKLNVEEKTFTEFGVSAGESSQSLRRKMSGPFSGKLALHKVQRKRLLASKKGNFGRLKRRWLQVEPRTLLYYKNEFSESPLGSFVLSESMKFANPPSGALLLKDYPHCMSISGLKDSAGRFRSEPLYIYADSGEELDEWMDALCYAAGIQSDCKNIPSGHVGHLSSNGKFIESKTNRNGTISQLPESSMVRDRPRRSKRWTSSLTVRSLNEGALIRCVFQSVKFLLSQPAERRIGLFENIAPDELVDRLASRFLNQREPSLEEEEITTIATLLLSALGQLPPIISGNELYNWINLCEAQTEPMSRLNSASLAADFMRQISPRHFILLQALFELVYALHNQSGDAIDLRTVGATFALRIFPDIDNANPPFGGDPVVWRESTKGHAVRLVLVMSTCFDIVFAADESESEEEILSEADDEEKNTFSHNLMSVAESHADQFDMESKLIANDPDELAKRERERKSKAKGDRMKTNSVSLESERIISSDTFQSDGKGDASAWGVSLEDEKTISDSNEKLYASGDEMESEDDLDVDDLLLLESERQFAKIQEKNKKNESKSVDLFKKTGLRPKANRMKWKEQKLQKEKEIFSARKREEEARERERKEKEMLSAQKREREARERERKEKEMLSARKREREARERKRKAALEEEARGRKEMELAFDESVLDDVLNTVKVSIEDPRIRTKLLRTNDDRKGFQMNRYDEMSGDEISTEESEDDGFYHGESSDDLYGEIIVSNRPSAFKKEKVEKEEEEEKREEEEEDTMYYSHLQEEKKEEEEEDTACYNQIKSSIQPDQSELNDSNRSTTSFEDSDLSLATDEEEAILSKSNQRESEEGETFDEVSKYEEVESKDGNESIQQMRRQLDLAKKRVSSLQSKRLADLQVKRDEAIEQEERARQRVMKTAQILPNNSGKKKASNFARIKSLWHRARETSLENLQRQSGRKQNVEVAKDPRQLLKIGRAELEAVAEEARHLSTDVIDEDPTTQEELLHALLLDNVRLRLMATALEEDHIYRTYEKVERFNAEFKTNVLDSGEKQHQYYPNAASAAVKMAGNLLGVVRGSSGKRKEEVHVARRRGGRRHRLSAYYYNNGNYRY
eukprot:g5885.t1